VGAAPAAEVVVAVAEVEVAAVEVAEEAEVAA
jgi:hypothetical protein